MNANEFRIGNWYSQFGNLHQVTWDTIKALGDAPETQLWCKPIPLSPEILEKCGFVYRNEHRGVGCIMDLGNIASVGILENGFRYLLLWQAPLKYLHQLQNIYFAHFGEELTFKQ